MNSSWKHRIFYMKIRQIYKVFFLFALMTFSFNFFAQNASWKAYPSPVKSELKSVIAPSNNSGFAAGTQLLLLENGEWKEIQKPSSSYITSLSISKDGGLLLGFPNKYQESDLYYYSDNTWSRVNHPLVGEIYCSFFIDRSNGVIGGLGEICL